MTLLSKMRRNVVGSAGLALGLALVLALGGCSRDWPSFRHNLLRNAHQPNDSDLADPAKVSTLHVEWEWPAAGNTVPGLRAFRGSPVVFDGKVLVGNGNGRFYAFRASDGVLLWQYPAAALPPLTSQWTTGGACANPSSHGIASSAAITSINGTNAVIFGAPDQSFGSGLGEGRLFALNVDTGAEIWKSPVVARLTGTSSGSTTQFHEQIGYSAPLVFNNHVYVGVADHCDNPIQRGRIIAVNLSSGTIDPAFSFEATSTRGGGVWSSLTGWFAGGNERLYVTTGNTKSGNPGGEPAVNHGLSLLQLNADTGSLDWKLQPVPFDRDLDPDWASGATVMGTDCGTLAVSTMKDGWTYAVDTSSGSCLWQFPETPPAGCSFAPGDGTSHGDIRYLRPGAAWRDVFITMTGGVDVTTDVTGGYRRLHGLNVCGSQGNRLRWLLEMPDTTPCITDSRYRLGPPSVTRGVVYAGTCKGNLVAFADPSLWPAAGWRCSSPSVPTTMCAGAGFSLVPEPAILANVPLQGPIMTEPVLARGRVFVATGWFADAGKLYMLEP